MREFAEQEIIIPDGPCKGERFSCQTQPYSGLWLDAIDAAPVYGWNRFVCTGPSQSGKTLVGWVIPAAYHLFELKETVILGLPDMDMAADKWREDLLPVIEETRYKEYLPRTGPGSRGGGNWDAIKFRHGVTLKFMSGFGGDKRRAAFTSRVVVITETDGMDQPGAVSREADAITQIENRTSAYGDRKRIYLECTLSIEAGRTWQEIKAGTDSRIVLPCPLCGQFVLPEREQLVGWQEAGDEIDAALQSVFCCPDCGGRWTDEQRVAANHRARLVHKGQTISPEGVVSGEAPRTRTLGFRWSAVHNLFWRAADIGIREWRAARDTNEENAEKEMRQFVWALPHEPPIFDITPLNRDVLVRRVRERCPKGFVPAGTDYLTVGVDLGKRFGWWLVVAWTADGTGHVVDYGMFLIPSDEFGLEPATLAALRDFKEVCLAGWARADDTPLVPDQVWVDSGYTESQDVVYGFCRENAAGDGRDRFRPTKGYGTGQDRQRWYSRPRKKSGVIRHIGEAYHISLQRAARVYLVEIDANYWKSWVHERLATPTDKVGTLTLFTAMPQEHRTLARHLTAEEQVEEFVVNKGVVRHWKMRSRTNHWFDCVYQGAAAAHFCGVRLVKTEERPVQTQAPIESQAGRRPGLMTEDGRPYLVTERS